MEYPRTMDRVEPFADLPTHQPPIISLEADSHWWQPQSTAPGTDPKFAIAKGARGWKQPTNKALLAALLSKRDSASSWVATQTDSPGYHRLFATCADEKVIHHMFDPWQI